MLVELNKTAQGSAERQLYTLLKRLIDSGDVDKSDIKVRIQSMMDGKIISSVILIFILDNIFRISIRHTDLVNPHSVTAMSLRYLPPLAFLL